MENQNNSSNYDFNFNIDDIIKIFETSGNIKSESIKRIINNKDELAKLVNECKNLFTKEQLCKIEKGIEELSQLLLSKSSPLHQHSPCQMSICPPTCTPSTVTTKAPPPNFLQNEVNLHLVLFFLLAILIIPALRHRNY